MSRCPVCGQVHTHALSSQRAKLILHLGSYGAVEDPLLLPDDSVVDEEAVWVASHGERLIRMTRPERALAATAIFERGGTAHDVCVYLGLPRTVDVDWNAPSTTARHIRLSIE